MYRHPRNENGRLSPISVSAAGIKEKDSLWITIIKLERCAGGYAISVTYSVTIQLGYKQELTF